MATTKRLSSAEVLGLAHEVKRESKKITIDPLVMASIAMIESSGDPKAYRFEPHLNEASAGLTQVLISTAQWLAKDMGFQEMGFPNTEDNLYQPRVALYFCGAYLTWLSTYKKQKRSEEFVVRGYNG
jgi:soluble lytic murein transglycosylase-like protein